MHNKECREVGRLHPSAFYLLNIINDQSLLHKGFPGNTGVWQPCSGILCLKAEVLFRCFTLKPSRLVTKADVGHTAAVQESSVQDRFLNPSFYFLLSSDSPFTDTSIRVCWLTWTSGRSVLPSSHARPAPAPAPGAQLPVPLLLPLAVLRALLSELLSPDGTGQLHHFSEANQKSH